MSFISTFQPNDIACDNTKIEVTLEFGKILTRWHQVEVIRVKLKLQFIFPFEKMRLSYQNAKNVIKKKIKKWQNVSP